MTATRTPVPKDIQLPENMTICAVCKKSADLACSACYRVVYCTENHQIEHWPKHEIPCANYSLRRSRVTAYQGPFQISEIVDLYDNIKPTFQMAAQVTIPAHEKILEEVPVLMAPWPRTKLRQCEDFRTRPDLRIVSLTCFGCCSVLDFKTAKRCFHCNLILCINCPTLHLHSENECGVIKKYQHFRKKSTEVDSRTCFGRLTEEEIEFLYQDVMMVRLILHLMKVEEKESGNFSTQLFATKFQGFKSERWNSLLRTWELHEETRKTESIRGAVAYKNLQQVFSYSLFLVNFDTSLVWRLFCILEANAFTFNLPFQRFNVLCSLLPKARHSCFPNAHAFLTCRNPETATSGEFHEFYTVTVLSGREIPTGTPITISYLPLVYSVFERRLILLDRYFFWCSCQRCFDPSEKDTYTSSISCHQCRIGYITPSAELLLMGPGPKPQNPFSVAEVEAAEGRYKTSLCDDHLEWTCSSKSCLSRTLDQTSSITKQLKKSTANAFEKYRLHEMASARCLGEQDQTFRFRMDSQMELHPNNSIILKLTEDILRGEIYSLNIPPTGDQDTLESAVLTDYAKTVSLALDGFEAYMKKVNPAFDFQGYPVSILNELRDTYYRREKPLRARQLQQILGVSMRSF